MRVAHDAGLAVGALEVRRVHGRDRVGDGADDGVADEVGEADLAAAGAAQVAVDDLAVDLEQLGRDLAERRGRGDREAGLHVGDDAGRRRRAAVRPAPPRSRRREIPVDLGAAGGAGAAAPRQAGRRSTAGMLTGLAGSPGGRQGLVGRAGRDVGVALVVREEVAPALADRSRVGEVLLVHLVDEPCVGPECVVAVVLTHRGRS